MMNSKFNIEINDKYAVIGLNDDQLGGSDALEFTNLINDLKLKNLNNVVCDLNNVKLMNSSGLGMLVAALSSFKKVNTKFTLVSIPDNIMNLITMTHLDKVFEIRANQEEVINSLDK